MHRFLAIALACAVLTAPLGASAQDTSADNSSSVTVTHGGYGALIGGLSLSLYGATAVGLGKIIYQDPLDVDCTAEPHKCRRTFGEHLLVGTLMVAAVAAGIGTGYGGQKLAERWEWNPVTGWALAGGYLGLPATLLLQNVIPKWKPEWSRDIVGVTLGVGGSIAAGFAFAAIAKAEGHAWPEFGFGAGGMALGLTVGSAIAKDTVWVPILGGLLAIIGASAAALAF